MHFRQDGFSYVIVMFLVAILAIISVRALEVTATAERRDKEAQLLWVGMAFRNAIAQYHKGTPGEAKAYPENLEALLYDERHTNPDRPLRKLYRDPMTGSPDWGLVRNGKGAVIGVYSLSQDRPAKKGGFPPELASFAGAQRYSDWKFVYQSEK